MFSHKSKQYILLNKLEIDNYILTIYKDRNHFKDDFLFFFYFIIKNIISSTWHMKIRQKGCLRSSFSDFINNEILKVQS